MSLTIIFSGPKSAGSQTRTALASAGYMVEDTEHDHGLPPSAIEGEDPGQPIDFITVRGQEPELDAAHAVARTTGFQLRMHHETPPMYEPSQLEVLVATVASLKAEIEELRNGR